MAKINLSRPWWYVILLDAMFLDGMLWGLWAFTWPAIRATWAGQSMPADLSWPGVIMADIMFVLVFCPLMWLVTSEFLVELTEEGVRTRGLARRPFVRWSEVRWVGTDGAFVVLGTEWGGVKINRHTFSRPEELMRIINERVARAESRGGRI